MVIPVIEAGGTAFGSVAALDQQHAKRKAPFWRVGPFRCELDGTAEPLVLYVSDNDEPVVEIVVLSTLDAEQQAQRLREVAERYLL